MARWDERSIKDDFNKAAEGPKEDKGKGDLDKPKPKLQPSNEKSIAPGPAPAPGGGGGAPTRYDQHKQGKSQEPDKKPPQKGDLSREFNRR